MAKVSVLILDEKYHGWYLHCRSPYPRVSRGKDLCIIETIFFLLYTPGLNKLRYPHTGGPEEALVRFQNSVLCHIVVELGQNFGVVTIGVQ